VSIARSRPRARPTRRSTRRRLARIAGRPSHRLARLAPHRGARRSGAIARPAVTRPEVVHPGIALPRERLRPGLRLAASVWWRGAELDHRLADGEDPAASHALALRAHRITAARRRARLANGPHGALRRARAGRGGFTAAVRPHSPDVLDAGSLIATIEGRLRDPEPVAARGVAIVRSLLIDGNSPLYRPGEPGVLGSRLRAAAAALGAAAGND
jgi:hypothetical protein